MLSKRFPVYCVESCRARVHIRFMSRSGSVESESHGQVSRDSRPPRLRIMGTASAGTQTQGRLTITSTKTRLECRNGGHGKKRLRPATRDLGGHFAHSDRGNIQKKSFLLYRFVS